MLAKLYTKEKDNRTAVRKFREVLESRDMFFNAEPFPTNESGEAAFFMCTTEQTSRLFCPSRWKAMQKWIKSTSEVSHIPDADDNDKFPRRLICYADIEFDKSLRVNSPSVQIRV